MQGKEGKGNLGSNGGSIGHVDRRRWRLAAALYNTPENEIAKIIIENKMNNFEKWIVMATAICHH